jgi:hypothetical protein
VCVYSTIVYHILFMKATLFDVCVLLLFSSLYTYRLNYFNYSLLQCYYREIVYIQVRLRDVQDPGVDNLDPPVSLL